MFATVDGEQPRRCEAVVMVAFGAKSHVSCGAKSQLSVRKSHVRDAVVGTS